MTNNHQDERAAAYELTISGSVGPVVRAALTPHVAAPSRTCTVLRTGAVQGDVLLELIRRLHRRGLDVEEIFEVRPRGSRGCAT